MASALLLSALLTMRPQPAAASAFQPHFDVRFQAAASRQAFVHATDDREVLCGMVVTRKAPADDPKILLPSRDTGAAARRIEPQVCGSHTTAAPK